MIRGLYTSTLGMMTQMKKMDVISNNIANIDTTGYKRDIVVTQSFSEELLKRLNDSGNSTTNKTPKVGSISPGVFLDGVYTDFTNGALTTTNGEFDLAIVGKGYFTINIPDKNGQITEKFTRDGSFTKNVEGMLVSKDGEQVLGQNGAIYLPEGKTYIDGNGAIYVNDELIDNLKISQYEDDSTLRKFKDSLYETTDLSKATPFTGSVLQGSLERSNVNSVKEMIEMINISRTYEASQRVSTVFDQTLNKAVNEIARK